MTSYRFTFILILLCHAVWIQAQSLVEIIDKTEKAAIEVRTYNSADLLTGSASGFFISADGLAITMGGIFEGADSAVVTLRNGRTLEVERIISVHPPSNMALVKVNHVRQKSFNFLFPSKQSFRHNEELLLYTHPNESEDGMILSKVRGLKYFPFVSRSGLLEGSYHTSSAGAPAINTKGEFCGIVNVSRNGKYKVLYNNYLLNDSSWVNINVSVDEVNQYINKTDYLKTELSQAILNIMCDQHIESAKCLSKYIKRHPLDEIAHSLRAYSRFQYQNMVGSREDLKYCQEFDPEGYLQYYVKGLIEEASEKDNEARINFSLCMDRNPDFAPAISELALLNLEEYNDVRAANALFTMAIESDSLYAPAYYQRAKLRMRYSSNEETTLEDINRTIYLDPELPGIYSLRGTIYFTKKDYLPSIRDFDRAIEKDIKDVHAWFNRGVAYYNVGLHEKACYDWEKAGKLGNYEAYKYISRYCKNVKRNVYKP